MLQLLALIFEAFVLAKLSTARSKNSRGGSWRKRLRISPLTPAKNGSWNLKHFAKTKRHGYAITHFFASSWRSMTIPLHGIAGLRNISQWKERETGCTVCRKIGKQRWQRVRISSVMHNG